MLNLDSLAETFKKVNKKKLVIGVVAVAAGVTIFLVMQRRVVQRTLSDVIDGFVVYQPDGMCITSVKAEHNIFPPKYGVNVDYVPCVKR